MNPSVAHFEALAAHPSARLHHFDLIGVRAFFHLLPPKAPLTRGGQDGRQSRLLPRPRPRASHFPSEHSPLQTRQEGLFPTFVETGPVSTPRIRLRHPNPGR